MSGKRILLLCGTMVVLGSTGACRLDKAVDPSELEPPVGDSSVAVSLQLVLSPPVSGRYRQLDTVSVTAVVLDYRGNPVNTGAVVFGGVSELVTTVGPRKAEVELMFASNRISASFLNSVGRTLVAEISIPAEPRDFRAVLWTADGRVREIVTPQGVQSLYPHDINDVGEVTGTAVLSDGIRRRAFTWSESKGYTELGILDSFRPDTEGRSINASGTVAGWSGLQAYTWTALGGMNSLGFPATTFSSAVAINSLGTVAGSSEYRAFRWRKSGGAEFLNVPGDAECSAAVAINDKDETLGYWSSFDDGWCLTPRVVVWDASGTITQITECRQAICDAVPVAINNGGEVVGNGAPGVFRWSRTTGTIHMQGYNAQVFDINDRGDAVGSRFSTATQPFIWRANGQVEILSLPAGARAAGATAINSDGIVAGWIK